MTLDKATLDDIENDLITQVESWSKAVQDGSVRKYANTKLFWLFVAAVGRESGACERVDSFSSLGTALFSELVPHRESFRSRVNEEAENVAKVNSRLTELPRAQRLSASKAAAKLKRVPEAFESCENVESAKKYLKALENICYQSSGPKKQKRSKVFYVEKDMWIYWIVYDTCLKLLNQQTTSVSAGNILDKCITAFDALKLWVTSADEAYTCDPNDSLSAKGAVKLNCEEERGLAETDEDCGAVCSSSQPESLGKIILGELVLYHLFVFLFR